MQDKTLSFERILSLTTLVANYLLYRYDVPIDLGESATLEVWVEHKEKILELADYSETSESEAERKVYLYISTKARPKAGCYQTKDANGKTIWKSPFNDEITGGYDTNNEETYLYLNDFDLTTQKEIYYQHERDFNLTNPEKLVIEMSFAGYNLYNDIDVLVFKEVLNTDSVGYVRTFFNRLCKKLEKESERIGLR